VELDITHFFESADAFEYSASAAELGQNAGKITWSAAVRDSAEYPLLDTPEKVEEWKDDVRGFGAWEDEEIDAWSVEECNALLIQFISGDIRDMESLCGDDWEEYGRLSERGTVSGRMYRGDDERIYFYVGT
jgi:hypothetical protein